MDRGLLQREVAAALGVDTGTVANWEVARSEPAVRHWPRIINFLGFAPLEADGSLSSRLLQLRRLTGRSQATLAAPLGVDESTLRGWEGGIHTPINRHRTRLDRIFTAYGLALNDLDP